MKAVVLAAGYGTRMQSLIGDTPKALIRIGDRTILDHLCENILDLGVEIAIVTNDRYHDQFLSWKASRSIKCEIINDGSTAPDNRLGAIGDLSFVVDELEVSDDLLITAADNLIPFPLRSFVAAFEAQPELQIAVWRNDDIGDQVRRGVVTVEKGVITEFQEKPHHPSSLDAAAPLYILPRALLPNIGTYLAEGGNPDAPGHLMAWLVKRYRAIAWQMPERMIDVGNPESYRRALQIYGN